MRPGVAIGLFAALREVSHVPFQFLRMISPSAWMPVAVLAFDTWDAAIVFLVAVAAWWPVLFLRRRGAPYRSAMVQGGPQPGRGWAADAAADHFPAIAQDIFAGIRLAVGVAWIVLVPAEYLGVTSGLGHAINDARDTLEYDTLAAVVVVIGDRLRPLTGSA